MTIATVASIISMATYRIVLVLSESSPQQERNNSTKKELKKELKQRSGMK